MPDPQVKEASDSDRLDRIGRELKTIREQLTKVLVYIHDAESEVPEKMRRFIMYMHDVHDVMWMYHENGVEVPGYIKKEAERCDDRFRQLLQELHMDGGTFDKVRTEMAKDTENRWDHTKRIAPPRNQTETTDETRPSDNEPNGLNQD